MKYIVGVDFGGTKIKAGLVNLNGKVLKSVKRLTESKKGKRFVINNLIKCVEEIISGVNRKDIIGIGIGAPGSLDSRKGVILNPPNLPGWRNVPLRRIIQKKLGLKVVLENDTNAMAFGESKFGWGRNVKDLVLLSLGTGVGSGIIIDKAIYHGMGNAAEIGHMTIVENGLRCSCGNRGCLEEYVSGRAVEREARKAMRKELSPLDVERLARKGNKKAIEVYRTIGEHLGVGLANVVNILNPELIIIGGGVSNAGDLILKPAVRVMKQRAFSPVCNVVISKLGSDAGIIGAARCVMR